MKLFLYLLPATVFLLPAQPVEVGVRGGVVLNSLTRYSADESRPFTFGPTVEFKLPNRFALETGFLYKRPGGTYSYQFSNTRLVSRIRGNSFEIPVVGKYYFRPPSRWTPYLGLGVAMRRASYTADNSFDGPFDGVLPPGRFPSLSPWGAGAVGAAGLKFRAGRWKFSPELRYTRWSVEPQALTRNPNQVELLFGISF